jgi:autotransporter-associated beta strand protein
LAAAVAWALSGATAHAQIVWDAGAGTGNWADPNNWSTKTVPLASDAVQFAGTLQATVATGGNHTLTFNAGANPFTINNSILTITAGAIINNSTNLQTVNSAITQGAATTYNAASGNFALGGAITTGGYLATISGGANTTFNGINSGAGGLSQSGTGLLTLSGVNTFTGATAVSSGTLRVTTSAAALGTGALNLSGGNLELAKSTGLAFNRATTVSANTTITSDRLTGGAGVTHTLAHFPLGRTRSPWPPGPTFPPAPPASRLAPPRSPPTARPSRSTRVRC